MKLYMIIKLELRMTRITKLHNNIFGNRKLNQLAFGKEFIWIKIIEK